VNSILATRKFGNPTDISLLIAPGFDFFPKDRTCGTTYYPYVKRNRGVVYQELGRLNAAEREINFAIQVDPNGVSGYLNRAIVNYLQEEFEESSVEISKAIEIDPASVPAYKFRGLCYLKEGNIPSTIADFEHAVRLDPADRWFVNQMARLLSTNPDGSIRDGTRAIEYARSACEATEWKEAAYLDTLAAAYAKLYSTE